jgi:hypothetical protein
LELTTPVFIDGKGFPDLKMADRGVGGAHSNVDLWDNTTQKE